MQETAYCITGLLYVPTEIYILFVQSAPLLLLVIFPGCLFLFFFRLSTFHLLNLNLAEYILLPRFRIYDIEKTVVDIVFYRERIGIEETKEVLTTYLNRSDRNLNRLIRYAELLKCGDVMKKYLEVLV